MIGRVRDFDRGFGFLVYEDEGGFLRNIFVHWRSICMGGYRHLAVGATVEFEIAEDYRGRHAEGVRVIESA